MTNVTILGVFHTHAQKEFSGPPWRHSLSDTGKQMYRGDVNGEF